MDLSVVLSLFFYRCCSPGPPGASHPTYFDCALLGCLPLGSIWQAAPDHASVRMQTAYIIRSAPCCHVRKSRVCEMECVHPWGQMIPSFEVQGKMWGLLFPLILKFTLHCLFLDSFATRMTLVQLCLHVIIINIYRHGYCADVRPRSLRAGKAHQKPSGRCLHLQPAFHCFSS